MPPLSLLKRLLNLPVFLANGRAMAGFILGSILTLGAFESQGAALYFDRAAALPGDVVTTWTGNQFGAVPDGTFGVTHYRIGVLDSDPLYSLLGSDGTFVEFGIPFGTSPGLHTISLYAGTFIKHSGQLTILASLPPVITSPTEAEGTNGVTFEYQVFAANNATNITAAPLPAGVSINTTGFISGTPTESGVFEVALTAKGEHPTPGTATLTLTVHPSPLAIISELGAHGTNGIPFSYQIETDHPATNYTALNLNLIVPGLSLDAETGLISGTPTVTGIKVVTIGAENGPWTDSQSLTLVFDPPPPVITSPLMASGRKNAEFTYTIEADNAPTDWSASPLPSGLSIDDNVIFGIPDTAGDFQVTLEASNAAGSDVRTLELSFLPQPPDIDSALTARGTNGMAFAYTITAVNDPAGFSADDRPAWMNLNPSTGALSGVPTEAGRFSVTIGAQNAGGSDTDTLDVTIAPAVPVITSTAMTTATKGMSFQFQITADNEPASFGSGPLPDGLSLNPQTGLISGVPTALGETVVDLTASNETGEGGATLTINVVDIVPVITSATTASGTRDVNFSYQIAADNNPASFDVIGSLPPGVTVNSQSGSISGRPTTAGVYTVTLQAINTGGTGDASLTITIVDKPPVITSPLTADATSGSLFTYLIEASNNPSSYDLDAGSHDWLTVNSETGQISGEPPVFSFSFSFQVTLRAINAGGTGTATLTITLTPATPVITSPTTASGAAGSPFQYQIQAANKPSGFQIDGFPDGFTVDPDTGLITGSPAAAMSFTGQVFASNAGGTGFAQLDVTIHRPIPDITSALTASSNAGAPFSYQITATQQPEFYEASPVPGLMVNTDTGLISGTPTATGEFMIHIGAGHAGGVGEAVLTLNFAAPEITSSLDVSTSVNAAFNYQITAQHTPTTFGAANLPVDLQVHSGSGVIEGLVTKPGVYEIPLTASAGALTAQGILRLTVWGADNEPPVGVFPSMGSGVRILWPAAASGYVLQSTDSLVPPVMWTDVTTTPNDSGSAKELLIQAASSGQAKYYRLVKP